MFDKASLVVYNIFVMKKQILNTIETHHLIKKGAHIVIGLSGGPDSVCLFDVLCSLAEEKEWKLYPVHINHRLRPKAAEQDQIYVESLCKERGWPCRSFVFDCGKIAREKKMTAEEAGREIRYEAFAKVAEDVRNVCGAKEDIVIAVGQNADDQAETILFRILRGTGTEGLSGIPYKRWDHHGNQIIRPLLDCYKKDIVEYCNRKNLSPCIDHTNMETLYMRNKIRLELLPHLEKEYNCNIKDTLIRMGKVCATDRAFLRQTTEKALESLTKEKTKSHVLLDGPGLRLLHPAIRQKVLAMALREIGLSEDLTFVHFQQWEDIVFHEKPSAQMDLPKGYCLTKNYEDVQLLAPVNHICEQRLQIRIMDMGEYQKHHPLQKKQAVFDADQMEDVYGAGFTERIILESRRAGDTIDIGNGKHKKIQDYLVDKKIPKYKRDQIKMVKIGHDVLWVPLPGEKGRFCSNFKLCSDTKKVICIEIICVL